MHNPRVQCSGRRIVHNINHAYAKFAHVLPFIGGKPPVLQKPIASEGSSNALHLSSGS
jgi:hypothetical protein